MNYRIIVDKNNNKVKKYNNVTSVEQGQLEYREVIRTLVLFNSIHSHQPLMVKWWGSDKSHVNNSLPTTINSYQLSVYMAISN